MNGECKSYKLNNPLSWDEFREMPDDIKGTYMKLLRNKFNVPDKYVAEMFHVCRDHFSRYCIEHGVPRKETGSRSAWDKEGFYAWINGVTNGATENVDPFESEQNVPVVEYGIPAEDIPNDIHEVEPNEEPAFSEPVPAPVSVPVTATPESGNLVFRCNANLALNMLVQILGDSKARISVQWDLIHDGGDTIYG